MALLEVEDLRVSFSTADGVVQAVRGISYHIDAGQTLGIVGESGSGKSVSTQTITGLTRGARISGRALFEGQDLLTASPDQMRAIRGAKIGMIFQDPLTSLHPLYKVGWQIVEMIRLHDHEMSKDQARQRAVELLRLVGIPQPERRVDDYPHQFSGGMRQRAMIAMAMALNPALLIADEPTTALDVTVQAQVLRVIRRMQEMFGTAVILITHDLGVIADVADEVLVMYGGKVMERADRRTLFFASHHPYTEGLLQSLPAYGGERERLRPIAGQPPSLLYPPPGCPFAPRCVYVMDRCRTEDPALDPAGEEPGHLSACLLPHNAADRDAIRRRVAQRRAGQVGRAGRSVREPMTSDPMSETDPVPDAASADGDDVLLRVENLVKYFPVGSARPFQKREQVHAVDGVSLTVRRGQTFGVVGETGCGKSTLARCVARLHDVTSGRIVFDGRDITQISQRRMRPLRREIQMIFQDPIGSLNPRRRVGSIIGDPYAIHGLASGAERKRLVQELMERVGLNPEHFNRFPAEFSGGQRQRIGVARALAFRPKLIICDEPVSALDVSIQAQVINLLADLQAEFGLTYIFIAHDLSVVRHVSNSVAVMYLGKITEIAPADELFTRPRHPYTGALLSAVPVPDPDLSDRRQQIILVGDVPSPIAAAVGLPVPPAVPQSRAGLRSGRSAARAAPRRRPGAPDRLPPADGGRGEPGRVPARDRRGGADCRS